MRILFATLLLLTALIPLAPSALAHQCASGTRSSECACPVPNDGQYHQHSSPAGSCQGGPGGSQSATPGGASQSVPGAALPLLLVGIGGAALTLRRGR
ncbi:MAG TPA: hypothetical protein VM370_06875 [Candidatus Thermoplasmatota archaeon]|nr:hypothetical protein [Candidatus Thermoplasmatota archaeon]